MEREDQLPVRLQLYLARCGLCSRRGALNWIESGRVELNGRVEKQPWVQVQPGDQVKVDGEPIQPEGEHIYLALNKPPHYLSSLHDPQGRKLVTDLIQPAIKQRLFHVGRLDYLSTGLLLLTNDGQFARIVAHPGYCCEKEYQVETWNYIPLRMLRRWLEGVHIEGIHYQLEGYQLLHGNCVQLLLHEGKNREIRRVFRAYGVNVRSIHRYRVGSVTLEGLQEGQSRHLRRPEIQAFLSQESRKESSRDPQREPSRDPQREPSREPDRERQRL